MLQVTNGTGITTMAQAAGSEPLPWDGVGKPISNGRDIKQTLIEAGLDWEVVKRPAWVDVTPMGEFDEAALAEGGQKKLPFMPKRVKGNYVLLRGDTMEPVSPFVGPRYKPIQNEDAFEVFRDFCDAGDMVMETAGSLFDGEHIWGLARMKDEYELCNGETINGYFLLMQSHVYGSALKAMFTPIRYPGGHMLVQNVNKSARMKRTYTMSHSRHFNEDRIAEIKEVMGVAEKVLADFVQDARELAATSVDDEATIRYFIQLFHPTLYNKLLDGQVTLPKRIEDLATWEESNLNLRKVPEYMESFAGNQLPTCRNTAWGLVQATNHVYDHVIGRSPDTRLEAVWMGKTAQTKLDALGRAQKLGEE